MPNRTTHVFAGGAIGLAIASMDKQKNDVSHQPPFAGLVGAVGGRLPDLLEPATNPNHRQFFHSILVLGTICVSMYEIYQWSPESNLEKFIRGFLLKLFGAYGSHLLLDMRTPKGLPLVGKF